MSVSNGSCISGHSNVYGMRHHLRKNRPYWVQVVCTKPKKTILPGNGFCVLKFASDIHTLLTSSGNLSLVRTNKIHTRRDLYCTDLELDHLDPDLALWCGVRDRYSTDPTPRNMSHNSRWRWLDRFHPAAWGTILPGKDQEGCLALKGLGHTGGGTRWSVRSGLEGLDKYKWQSVICSMICESFDWTMKPWNY